MRTIILRRWTGRIRTADEQTYTRYFEQTGARDYGATPGNLGFQMLLRSLEDGTSEITTLSWWSSMRAIVAFAGEPPERARYYPEDDRYLLTRPETVEHHRVAYGPVWNGAPA
jgi:heme-degrading monooxygenase HmoA